MAAQEANAEASPFHEGELAIQQRYGVDEKIGAYALQAIRDHLIDQHRRFFEMLPLLLVGAVDRAGRPWASVLSGDPGFMQTPDPHHLRINASPLAGDPISDALLPGAKIGGLGVAFENRRRNRFAATVASRDDSGLTLEIEQSFGNCPQYILSRVPVASVETNPAPPETLSVLDDDARALISRSDTFFIATAAPANQNRDIRYGADVSHRGGKPGFVRVAADGIITVPDFAGNQHFNTLGNLMLDPRAGLLFVDFVSGDLLYLTGAVDIDFDSPEIQAFQGAERLWHFMLDEAVRLRGALPLRYGGGEASPNSLITGDWQQAHARIEAEKLRNSWRPWRIERIVDESATIRSFYLEPTGGNGRPSFKAGQFVPIRLDVPGHGLMTRTYTVSSAPEDKQLRISVKRDGVFSNHLHGLGEGASLQAQAPRGAFTIDTTTRRPAVMISAGIGITPMISMMRHTLVEGLRTRHTRPIWFIHAAKSRAARAFFDEAAAVLNSTEDFRSLWLLSQPEPDAEAGVDHHLVGRLQIEHLKRWLPFDDYDFYLCGPAGFVQDIYDDLRDLNIADDRILAESFGPSSLQRRADRGADEAPKPSGQAEVTFAISGRKVNWTPEAGTLLELAEANGMTPEFGCRAGGCGSCAVKLMKGQVKYLSEPTAPIGPSEALICCAVPDATADGPTVELELAL